MPVEDIVYIGIGIGLFAIVAIYLLRSKGKTATEYGGDNNSNNKGEIQSGDGNTNRSK